MTSRARSSALNARTTSQNQTITPLVSSYPSYAVFACRLGNAAEPPEHTERETARSQITPARPTQIRLGRQAPQRGDLTLPVERGAGISLALTRMLFSSISSRLQVVHVERRHPRYQQLELRRVKVREALPRNELVEALRWARLCVFVEAERSGSGAAPLPPAGQ